MKQIITLALATALLTILGTGHMGRASAASTGTVMALDFATGDNTATSVGMIQDCIEVDPNELYAVDVVVTNAPGDSDPGTSGDGIIGGAFTFTGLGFASTPPNKVFIHAIRGPDVQDGNSDDSIVDAGAGLSSPGTATIDPPSDPLPDIVPHFTSVSNPGSAGGSGASGEGYLARLYVTAPGAFAPARMPVWLESTSLVLASGGGVSHTTTPGILAVGGATCELPVIPGTTSKVSVPEDGNDVQGNSREPEISYDGSLVAFEGGGLLPEESTFNASQIYLRDLALADTLLISKDMAGNPAASYTIDPALSANGRFVAFASYDNLLGPDTNLSNADVFVRDLHTDSLEMVSLDTEGNQGNDSSSKPVLSADGRLVAFVSRSTDLIAGDTNGAMDLFLRDRETQTTLRVAEEIAHEYDLGEQPVDMTPDGRYVAFESWASNLVPDDTNNTMDVFVVDRDTGQFERISLDNLSQQASELSFSPAISDDGRFVAFATATFNLTPNDYSPYTYDVYVRDRLLQTTERISVALPGYGGNEDSSFPAISGDGRFVAFDSWASNLVFDDANWVRDVFVRDRKTATTVRVTLDSNGIQSTSHSLNPSISVDGRRIVFTSGAPNLVEPDTNQVSDVFMHDLGDADADGEWNPWDNCPLAANQDQEDFNSDGEGDVCDDTDVDGVPDASDNCRTIANTDGQLTDTDGDSAGDACDAPGTGNVDCSGPVIGVNSVDALKVLRYSAGLSVVQSEPCLDIGMMLPSGWAMGDVNCSGEVDAVDALLILRAVAGLSTNSPQGCPPIKPQAAYPRDA